MFNLLEKLLAANALICIFIGLRCALHPNNLRRFVGFVEAASYAAFISAVVWLVGWLVFILIV